MDWKTFWYPEKGITKEIRYFCSYNCPVCVVIWSTGNLLSRSVVLNLLDFWSCWNIFKLLVSLHRKAVQSPPPPFSHTIGGGGGRHYCGITSCIFWPAFGGYTLQTLEGECCLFQTLSIYEWSLEFFQWQIFVVQFWTMQFLSFISCHSIFGIKSNRFEKKLNLNRAC